MITKVNGVNTSYDYYNKLLEMIKEEITKVTYLDKDFYRGYTFQIANEQFFNQGIEKDRIIQNLRSSNADLDGDIDEIIENALAKTLYIVVKFSSASINFGQTVMPASIDILSEKNGIEVAQRLASDFTSLYNTEMNSDYTIKQVYEAPTVISNFNEVYDGYRSVLSIETLFLISEDANYVEVYYVTEDEEGNEVENKVDFLHYKDNFQNNLNTQAFSSTGNSSVSVATTSVFTFGLTIYFRDEILCNDAWDVKHGFEDNDKIFKFYLKYRKTGKVSNRKYFTLVGMTGEKAISDFQATGLTFALADTETEE